MAPNTHPGGNTKENLETSIISNALFGAGFSEIIMDFQKRLNAPFLVSF